MVRAASNIVARYGQLDWATRDPVWTTKVSSSTQQLKSTSRCRITATMYGACTVAQRE